MNTIPKSVLMEYFQKHEPEASSSPQTYRKATCAGCGTEMVEMWHCWLDDDGVKKELHFCDNCHKELSVPETLVIIVKYGEDFIQECLNSIPEDYQTLIFDNTPGNETSILSTRGLYHKAPYPQYMTGALLWAYENVPAKNYFLMQDSMVALDPNFLQPFKDKQPERGCVAWCTFPEGFDNEGQLAVGRYFYTTPYPDKGIFGGVFYVSHESLDELAQKQLLPPTPRKKDQEMANERLWSWAFHEAGMTVESVAGNWDGIKMQDGTFPVFRKVFGSRP